MTSTFEPLQASFKNVEHSLKECLIVAGSCSLGELLKFFARNHSKFARSLAGTTRALLQNAESIQISQKIGQ